MQTDYNHQTVLIIDKKLNIKSVIFHENPSFDVHLGESVIHLFDDASQTKLYDGFKELKAEAPSISFQAVLQGMERAFVFMLMHEGQIMLFLIGLHEKISPLFDELIQINNEQMNLIRNLYKRMNNRGDDSAFFEEIMKVNNTLINAKRELKYKNNQLKALNEALEVSNHTDYLTKAFNRRKFYQDIKTYPKQQPYKLLMIDFNNFRLINNELGHAKGDETLIYFTKTISHALHPFQGYVYRLGGDEFAILVPSSTNHFVNDLIIEVNQGLRKFHQKVSVSYGEITVDQDTSIDDDTLESLLMEADQAMYQHKSLSKRNQEA